MPIPSYEDLALPVLETIDDGATHAIGDVRRTIAARLRLTEEELVELLPSGSMPVFNSRVHWAKTYLEKAGALSSPRRGHIQITERGRGLLARNLPRIDNAVMSEFAEFVEWRSRSQQRQPKQPSEVPARIPAVPANSSPEETIESAHAELRSAVEDELLGAISAGSPQLLERVVVSLLVALGYGGAGDSGKHLGRSGDGGVDGVIWEDKLGLDLIYVQAKRWQNTVGRPEIQAFSGSLDGFRARKGVFITTSTFSAEARSYVASIEKKIVLIDGHELARLLFDTELGVSTERTYAVKRLDSDYFAEDF